MDRKARPTRIVRLVFSFIGKNPLSFIFSSMIAHMSGKGNEFFDEEITGNLLEYSILFLRTVEKWVERPEQEAEEHDGVPEHA